MTRLMVSELKVRQWYLDPFSEQRVRIVRILPGKQCAIAEYWSKRMGRYYTMDVRDGELEAYLRVNPIQK